jgi:hypothetical protein
MGWEMKGRVTHTCSPANWFIALQADPPDADWNYAPATNQRQSAPQYAIR